MDDRDLVRRTLGGDRTAYRRLIERDRRKAPRSLVKKTQEEIAKTAHSLQARGVIRSGTSPMTVPRVDVRTFGDLARLTDYEMQATLMRTETKTLAQALIGRGRGIREAERRVMENVSRRVQGFIRDGIATLPRSQEIIRASQEEIVGTVRWLQIMGRIRPGSRKPTRRQFERAVSEAARQEIEHGRHSGQWAPRYYSNLVPYLAAVIRDGGVEAARKEFEGIRDPVFDLGLRLLQEGAERREMIQQLQTMADEETGRMAHEYGRMITGFAAIRDGKGPRDVHDRLSGT